MTHKIIEQFDFELLSLIFITWIADIWNTFLFYWGQMEQLLFADIGATSYCGHQSNFVLRTNGTTFICRHRSNFILRTSEQLRTADKWNNFYLRTSEQLHTADKWNNFYFRTIWYNFWFHFNGLPRYCLFKKCSIIFVGSFLLDFFY